MQKKLISVTDITSWLYCPRKVYLKKIKGLREPPNQAMIKGKLKHDILNFFSKSESQIVLGIKKDLEKFQIAFLYEDVLRKISNQIFSSNFKSIEKFQINLSELFKKTLNDFSRDIGLRVNSIKQGIGEGFLGEQLWQNLSPKYFSEFKLESENLGLKGRVDRFSVETINGKKKIIPYEIKNREGKIYHSDEIQVTAYAMLLQDYFKAPINIAVIESGKERHNIEITEETKKEILEIAEKIRDLETNPPPLLSNFNKCRTCGFSEHC